MARAPFRLGPVERKVGILHQLRQVVVAGLAERDADADPYRHRLRLDRERLVERRHHPLRYGFRRRHIHAGAEQRELVAPEPRDLALLFAERRAGACRPPRAA